MAMGSDSLDDTSIMFENESVGDAVSGPAIGANYGDYKIISLLGRGGMGAVYEAEEIDSGRRVALKVLNQSFPSDEHKQRFLREGRLAASINHPNSVYIYGAYEIAGRPVIAMELVPGGTFKTHLKEGKFTVTAIVDSMLKIIDGLEEAHRKGVLHRDVKPSNCFISHDGEVKIGDFGLSISTLAHYDMEITRAGHVHGTPAFASPEQLKGNELDCRTDIYSVGITLYYLLTGKLPFRSDNMYKLISEIQEGAAQSPALINPAIPGGLVKVVQRCMAKSRESRYKNYSELRRALIQFSSQQPTAAALMSRTAAYFCDHVLFTLTFFIIGSIFNVIQFNDSFQTSLTVALLSQLVWITVFGVSEGLYGVTPGKMLFGCKVAACHGKRLGVINGILRSALFFTPNVIIAVVASQSQDIDILTWVGVGNILLTAVIFSTMRRRNGYAGMHDLISKARVVQSLKPITRENLAFPAVAHSDESAEERTIGPYKIINNLGRNDEEQLLEGYDPVLMRSVWMRNYIDQSVARPLGACHTMPAAGLHWIAGQRSDDACWDAYEAPGGAAFLDLAREGCCWGTLRLWLCDIAQAAEEHEKSTGAPALLKLEQIWIAGNNRAKVLDFTPPQFESDTPGCLVDELVCRMVEYAKPKQPKKNTDIYPLYVNESISTIKHNQSKSLVSILEPLQQYPTRVSTRKKLAGFLTVISPGVIQLCLVMAFFALTSLRSNEQLNDLSSAFLAYEGLSKSEFTIGDYDSKQTVEFLEMYVSVKCGDIIDKYTDSWSDIPYAYIELRTNKKKILKIREKWSDVSEDKKQQMEDAFNTEMGKIVIDGFNLFSDQPSLWSLLNSFSIIIIMVTAMFVAFPAFAAAVLCRRGLILRVCSIEFVTSDGKAANRLRLIARSIIVWLPLVVLFYAKFSLYNSAAVPYVGMIYLGLAVWSVFTSKRTIQDKLSGTWVVPV